MTIRLDEETERLIQEKVKAGMYESPEMMICAGIERLLQDESEFPPGELERLCQVGVDQLKRGEGIGVDTAFAMLEKRINEKRAGRR
ncbi:MAG: hypothetical protein H7Z14_17080 [Anaerolineae bacterium]|nr:hypothetical protein [Phycisphaerae bacterium]